MSTNVTDPTAPANVVTEISSPAQPASACPFYTHGPREVPLLGETIGENLRRTVARSGERDALVVGHRQFRATYTELWRQVDLAARAFLARGHMQPFAHQGGVA